MSKLPKPKLRTVGLIVPDVHEQIVKLKAILRHYSDVDWVVFHSDFMDSFNGLTWQTHETVKWLAANVQNPKYKFCWANHDLSYAFPIFDCPGFDRNKLEIVQKHLNDNDHWKRFKLFHWIGTPANDDERGNVPSNEWLISHAGIHPSLLNPILGLDKRSMEDLADEAMYKLRYGQMTTSWIAQGRGRGGYARVGGIVWLDWNTEFVPIPGLNQIVGHSFDETVRVKKAHNSVNWCIDTALRYVVEVKEDGSLQLVKVESSNSQNVNLKATKKNGD